MEPPGFRPTCPSKTTNSNASGKSIELGVIERHFNNLQSNYRALASTWLLAALAGIGFVISKELTLRIPAELIIGAIGIAAGIGVYLLWVLDLLVYQRLLDAAYIEARNLETNHLWLPQVRNNMRVLLGGRGLALVVWFYIAGSELMVIIAGIGLFRFLALRQAALLYGIEVSAYLSLLVLIPMHMRKQTTLTPRLESKLREERIRHA
jgi:hypothetical protein